MSLNMSIKHQKELDKANSINVIRKLLGLGHDLPAYLEEALETLTTAIFTFRRNCKIKPGQTAYFLVTGEEWIAGVLKEWPNSQWQKLAQPIPNTAESWMTVADQIRNNNSHDALGVSLAMLGPDKFNQIREWSTTTPAGYIPAVIVMTWEGSGLEHWGVVASFSIPPI